MIIKQAWAPSHATRCLKTNAKEYYRSKLPPIVSKVTDNLGITGHSLNRMTNCTTAQKSDPGETML